MEALDESVRSWCMEEDDDMTFPKWRIVGEYRDPIKPTSFLAKFLDVLLELLILLNSRV